MGGSSGNIRSGGGVAGAGALGRGFDILLWVPGGIVGGGGGGTEGLREVSEGSSAGPGKGAGATAIGGAEDATSKAIRL